MNKKIDRKSTKELPQNPTETLPALIFAAKTKSEEGRLARLKREKKIRKVGARLYTSIPGEVENVVLGNWSNIVSQLYPESLLSYRSALEYKPSPSGDIILTSTTNRIVKYPGLTLHFVRGPKAQESDLPFLGFNVSSQGRAFLENLSTTKNTAWRALSVPELESRLNAILAARGENEVRQILQQAREIAKNFAWDRELKKLENMIGALLGEVPAHKLESSIGRARARGLPYDAGRVSRFDNLYSALRATPLKELKDNFKAADHFKNKAFFEAYFSNYIEGTTFEVEEAEEIIFDKKIPVERPKDAHDILGTFNIVADANEMRKVPKTPEELLTLVKGRHNILMANRPEASPGRFKDRPNRVGDSHFVRPDEVEGTMKKGFERYQELPAGLARAVFVMFLVAEIHPFVDGNGRVARIMMNAELCVEALATIIIPTVYREDYLAALRALTRRDRPEPLIKMLARAHSFSNREFSPYKKILNELTERNWFREPDDGKIVEV